MLAVKKKRKNEKGSILIETVFSCLLLMLFFYAFLEMFFMIQSDRYAIIIAREGAREAGITSSISIGEAKAKDLALQYYGSLENTKIIKCKKNGPSSVSCVVIHEYKPFKSFTSSSGMGVNLLGTAIFPFQ